MALPSGRRSGRRFTPHAALGLPERRAGGRPPATDLEAEPPVRQNLYLRPAHLKALVSEVQRRTESGQRSDLSRLVREILDRWMEQQQR
jgi:hypothetical protein